MYGDENRSESRDIRGCWRDSGCDDRREPGFRRSWRGNRGRIGGLSDVSDSEDDGEVIALPDGVRLIPVGGEGPLQFDSVCLLCRAQCTYP